jgi:HPt (histidine-containing phosphotransfer) domain-containing protein
MKYINLDYINSITEGNDELFSELSNIFISQMNEVVSILESALNDKDSNTIKQAAHKIKSSLRTFGVEDLANKFEGIELQKEIIFDDNFTEVIKDLIAEANNVVSELEEYLMTQKR